MFDIDDNYDIATDMRRYYSSKITVRQREKPNTPN